MITETGDIIFNDVLFLQNQCFGVEDMRILHPPENHKEKPLHKEVFVMSIYASKLNAYHYYHKLIEAMPRIAPYLDFLKQNPSILIHAGDAHSSGRLKELLLVLGIPSSRIISGVIRARVAYVPQNTACGDPQGAAIALLAHRYRQYINENMKPALPSKPDTVILIHRSQARSLLQHKSVAKSLEELSQRWGLQFAIFSDEGGPLSLNDTMELFYRALLVVGPHGAGLSNLIFSRPGTYVVEALCPGPQFVTCFIWESELLGHHYYGVRGYGEWEDDDPDAKRKCRTQGINTDEHELVNAAKTFLEMHFRQG